MRFVHIQGATASGPLVSIAFVTTNGHEWTLIFSPSSAMLPVAVVVTVPAAKVISRRRHASLYSSNYGRARGVGRALGVGVTLGAGVGVAVGVAVGVGVGVGLGATGTIA
jgi:hypothetical protein